MMPTSPQPTPDDPAIGIPRLALIGGRLEPNNTAIYAALRELSGGRIAVLATASLMPDQAGVDTVADFALHGITAEVIPLSWLNRQTAAYDPALAARVLELGSVFFTGGDQSLLIGALRQNGVDTPVLQAINAVAARGGLISGSSAGAAVMSALSILGGTSLEAVVHGVAANPGVPGLLLGPGLGFFPYGIVDQHFIQRGRIGRLLVAMAANGARYGFGVDENTALIVEGTRLRVIGEKGVIVLDATRATHDIAHRHYEGFRVSYLDDGDAYDAAQHAAIPQATRKAIRRSRAFRGPGFVQRSVFGPNAFDELLTRLAEGDPERYARDHALAYEPDAQIEVQVEIERGAAPNQSLCARRGRLKRYTVLDYGLTVRCRPLTAAAHKEASTRQTRQLMRGRKVAPAARLIAIGAALNNGAGSALVDYLRDLGREITVVAVAAAGGTQVAHEYVAMLAGHGIAARTFEPKANDALERIAHAPAILFTGGNQDRLLQALFHLGEESPLLEAVLASYRAGGVLIAIGGSANALSPAMISGGSSEEAILFGASPDPWYRGVVLQEGLGLLRDGLVDQYFVGRNRLGRLLVACVEEGMRYGFGLAEDSALVSKGGGHKLRAVGGQGFAVLDLQDAVVKAHPHGFAAQDVAVRWVVPGQVLNTGSGEVSGKPRAETCLPQIVARFAEEANGMTGCGEPVCRVSEMRIDSAVARFNIEVNRPPEGRRSIPELDSKGRPKRD
jgi:cyanophycinase